MLKVLTKREKIILYITIGVIFFGISFNFLIAPILTKNENLNKEINASKTKLKRYLRLLSQKEYIQGKYSAKFSSAFNLSEQKEDSLVIALSELENLAKDAEIRIVDLRPQGPSKSLALYKETLIDLRAEGTMEGYLKFIYNLQNSPSLLKIKRFQLNAKPNIQVIEGIFSISRLSIVE